jgi:uncharacterized RDD family membrane protein YckC
LPQWKRNAGDVSASASSGVSDEETLGTHLVDPEAPDLSEQRFAASVEGAGEDMQQTSSLAEDLPVPQAADANSSAESAPACNSPAEVDPSEENSSAWRDELSARLNRYRARRKMRPPRYPSLRLQFDAVESLGGADAMRTPLAPPAYKPVSDHALALDGMAQYPAAAAYMDVHLRQEAAAEPAPPVVSAPTGHAASGHASAGHISSGHSAKISAKIIEFPRFAWGPPPPPPDQLAEPVSDRPRILEAPEIALPAPALGGITIEAAERQEAEKRPGIDIPLQSAPLARRVLASGVDGLIVALAAAVFGSIFWKVAAVRPPLVQALGLTAGIPCLFWAVYQYLLIVYTGSTPGLRAAKLELARFDGTSTNRRLRRWRVLAACLSGVSLGMGYAWVFLDEDVLCWHDRITHTYLAPGKSQFKSGFPKT